MMTPNHVLSGRLGEGCRQTSRLPRQRRHATRRAMKIRLRPAGRIARLVEAASRLTGPTLVLVDVAIGLPAGLFDAMRTAAERRDVVHVIDLLRARLPGDWFGEANQPEDWSIRSPYIRVPKGDGSLTAFVSSASAQGVNIRRAIDADTAARSPLILSGIPGTVGSGSRDVLGALGNLDSTKVAVWPFDGALTELLASGRIVVGEILSACALRSCAARRLSRRAFAPRGRKERRPASERPRFTSWNSSNGIKIVGIALAPGLLVRARGDEDDFDAYLSALAVTRLLVEGVPLEDAALRRRTRDGRPVLDTIAEGGMLGVLATQLERRQRAFAAPRSNTSSAREEVEPMDPRPSRSRKRGPAEAYVRVTRGSSRTPRRTTTTDRSRSPVSRRAPPGKTPSG